MPFFLWKEDGLIYALHNGSRNVFNHIQTFKYISGIFRWYFLIYLQILLKNWNTYNIGPKGFSSAIYKILAFICSWHYILVEIDSEKRLVKTQISEMVFCYQNCSDLLWEKIVLVIEKIFEITRTIYSNSERSE